MSSAFSGLAIVKKSKPQPHSLYRIREQLFEGLKEANTQIRFWSLFFGNQVVYEILDDLGFDKLKIKQIVGTSNSWDPKNPSTLFAEVMRRKIQLYLWDIHKIRGTGLEVHMARGGEWRSGVHGWFSLQDVEVSFFLAFYRKKRSWAGVIISRHILLDEEWKAGIELTALEIADKLAARLKH